MGRRQGGPRLQTEKGWVILYHGVRITSSGCIYRLGQALLDMKDPTRLLARGDEWVFTPEEAYEISGDVDKVVFPFGWLLEGDDIRMYYGGADNCIAVARVRVSELLSRLEKHSPPDQRLEKRL